MTIVSNHKLGLGPSPIDVGDIHEDPRGRMRTVPMRVLCLGMGRNGTESLCTALTVLQIPTYHGWQTIANPRHSMLWYEAALYKFKNQGKPWTKTEFDQVLGRSSACTDGPASMFAIELIEAYPEAKIILNRRPVEEWWASWQKNILPIKESWSFRILGYLDWEFYQTYILWTRMQDFWFRGDPRRNGPQVYEEHCAMIRGATSPDKLLEWDPVEGWEPLCRFLDLPVPARDFPSMNQTEQFNRTVDWYFRPRLLRARRNLVIISVTLAGLGAWMWRDFYLT